MAKKLDDYELLALKDALVYNPDTGSFVWAKARGTKCPKGSKAGTLKPHGYWVIGFKYVDYSAHRLAWTFVNGMIPNGMEIDHINGNPSDNRINNLRLATHSQNGQNKCKAILSNTTSGLLGVSLHRASNLWRARIKVNGKQLNLGYFKDKMEAFNAYIEAKNKHHFTGAMA